MPPSLIPIDAIQEFNTQVNPKGRVRLEARRTSPASALKSGTNDNPWASAYGFGRSDPSARAIIFNPAGDPKTPVELEQYGGSAGGHIITDRLFYLVLMKARCIPSANLPFPDTSQPRRSCRQHPACRPTMVAWSSNLRDCTISIPNAIADLVSPIIQVFTVNPLSNYLLGFYTPNADQGSFVSLNYPTSQL